MEDKKSEVMEQKEEVLTLDELKGIMKETVAETTKSIEEEIKRIKEELKSQKEVKEENDPEVSKKFIKDLVEGKAISTQSSSFGYTVPTSLANKVLEKRDKIAKVRPRATTFKMAGKFDLPVESTAVTAYHVGENVQVTESNPTIGKKSLDDWYLAARVLIPYKLLDTSAINVEAFVSNLCGRALANLEETDFVAGDGSSKPKGFRQETVGTVYLGGATLAYNDLVNLYYELKEQYRQGAVFITSTAGVKLIKRIKDENGMPIFNVTDNTLFGKPLIETEDIPSNLGTSGNETEIWFADLSYYWIKDGVEMIAERDKIIDYMQSRIVFHEAVDGCVVLSDAFKVLTGVK
jgi:HK97 family phage major capsid protein